MKLKGNMVIELVDGNTGEEERIEEANMVTNAVNDILGLNPMGIFYAVAGEYDTHLLWNDKLLPICPNMVGGILLFPQTLEEDYFVKRHLISMCRFADEGNTYSRRFVI